MTKLLHDVIKQREYFGKHEKDICSAYTINADSVSLHDTRGLGFSSIFDKDLPKDTTITSYYVGQNKDTIIGLMTKQQPWAELIDDNKKLVRHSNGRYGGYYADTVNITLK